MNHAVAVRAEKSQVRELGRRLARFRERLHVVDLYVVAPSLAIRRLKVKLTHITSQRLSRLANVRDLGSTEFRVSLSAKVPRKQDSPFACFLKFEVNVINHVRHRKSRVHWLPRLK